MPTSDIQLVNQGIYSRLETIPSVIDLVGVHPTLKGYQIFFNGAPPESAYPLCVFKYLGGAVKTGGGAKKIFSKMSYSILLTTTGFLTQEITTKLFQAYTDIELRFQQDQTVEDEVWIGLSISNPLSFQTQTEGVIYDHLGYQISLMAYNHVP